MINNQLLLSFFAKGKTLCQIKVDQLLYFQIPDSYWSETSGYFVADTDSCTIKYTNFYIFMWLKDRLKNLDWLRIMKVFLLLFQKVFEIFSFYNDYLYLSVWTVWISLFKWF